MIFNGEPARQSATWTEWLKRITQTLLEFDFQPIINGFTMIWEVMNDFASGAVDIIAQIKDVFTGGGGIAGAMGLDEGTASTIQNYLAMIKDTFQSTFDAVSAVVMYVFDMIKTYIPPILQEVVSFVKSQLDKLTSFWSENGEQIKQAGQRRMAQRRT